LRSSLASVEIYNSSEPSLLSYPLNLSASMPARLGPSAASTAVCLGDEIQEISDEEQRQMRIELERIKDEHVEKWELELEVSFQPSYAYRLSN
jgi:hypothetical protein